MYASFGAWWDPLQKSQPENIVYKDKVDKQRLAVAALESEPNKDDPNEKEIVITSNIHESVASNARSLQNFPWTLVHVRLLSQWRSLSGYLPDRARTL